MKVLKNKAELLGEQIYNAVMKEHQRLGLVVVNRVISYDYTRIFKETSLDYTGDCILVERLFLRKDCEMQKKKVQKLSDEAVELRNEVINLAMEANNADLADEERLAKVEEALRKEQELSKFKPVDAEMDLLTCPVFLEKDDGVVVLDLSDEHVSKMQYKSFCAQMAYFAYNYFAAMIMMPIPGIDLEVLTVLGTSYVDIVCKIKG
jgi:hypothetical protein